MLKFLISVEFCAAIVVLSVCLTVFGLGDLANIIQVTQVFAWAYIIHRLHRHHHVLEALKGRK